MARLAVGYHIQNLPDGAGWKLKTLEDPEDRKMPSKVCAGGDDLKWIPFTKKEYPGLTLDDTQPSTCDGEDHYYILDCDDSVPNTPDQDYKQQAR